MAVLSCLHFIQLCDITVLYEKEKLSFLLLCFFSPPFGVSYNLPAWVHGARF